MSARSGIAVSPQRPDVVYASDRGGRQEAGLSIAQRDAGESWKKHERLRQLDRPSLLPGDLAVIRTASTASTTPMDVFPGHRGRRQDLRADPRGRGKHVDNHAVAVRSERSELPGRGAAPTAVIYQSWDRGKTWRFTANLPITQFYKICVDNASPFYNIYGGTQDNNTQGGPTRTRSRHGITNEDWFITVGGDGFKPQVDPTDPNTVYSHWQYGNLVRFDRTTGSTRQHQAGARRAGEVLKWNWDSALLISPHLEQAALLRREPALPERRPR